MTRFRLILFDLDETLYPRSANLMVEISRRINQYLVDKVGVPADQAAELRRHFRGTYGTALRGLMEEGYALDVEDYFQYVHDVELHGRIDPDPALRTMLLNIPLRRAVLTNSNIEHAERILTHMAIRDCFERVIDIKALNFKNKPAPESYALAMEMLSVGPEEVIFVEDSPMNTASAKAIGMTTILVDCPPSDDADYFVSSVMDVGVLVARLVEEEMARTNGNDPPGH
jgi:putative hydrolase of the HAD superfamily